MVNARLGGPVTVPNGLYYGPIALPDGTVLARNCIAAMDAIADLGMGNVMQEPLLALWRSERMRSLRAAGTPALNPTCAG